MKSICGKVSTYRRNLDHCRIISFILLWLTLPSANAIVAPKAVFLVGDTDQTECIDLAVSTRETVYGRNHGVGSGHRFYDPSLQRWVNQDPIGEEGGINLYGFVSNDPVNRFDPYGESDNNRPPAIVFRPGSGKLPVYGPARPEPGVRTPGRDPVDSTIDAISLGLTLFDVLNFPVSPGPDGALAAAAFRAGAKKCVRKVRQKGSGKFKSSDDALKQLEEIEEAQRKVRQGKSGQIIDSISKSKQRAKQKLRDIADDPDLLDDIE